MQKDSAETNNVMEQYTSLLQTSARLRNPDAEPVEQPEPEVVEEEVEEEVVEEEVVEEVIEEVEEPKPTDPLSSLFTDLEQVFSEGAEVLEPLIEPEPVVIPETKITSLEGLFSEIETLFSEGAEEIVVEEVDEETIVDPTISEKDLQDFFAQLEGKVTDEEPEPIVEQVEELTEEILEEFVPSNDPMEQYTSLLKSTRKISNDQQGVSEEANAPATMGDLKRLANNLQKSLSSLGGGGVGENDVIKIIRQYGGELGGGSGSGETDGGSASSIYLPEQLIDGGDANGE